jgi:hypothetical protein
VVEEGGEGGALTPHREVPAPKVGDDGKPYALREACGTADLEAAPELRVVGHGLAVGGDRRDPAHLEPRLGK